MDADLLRAIHQVGMSGAFLFAWTDEWFKFSWNTQAHQLPADRRQLWHDPWTNEQYFGVLATDPRGGADARPRVVHESPAGVREVTVGTDESWIHLAVTFDEPPTRPFAFGFDVVPDEALPEGADETAGSGELPRTGGLDPAADYAAVIDPAADEGQAYVRQALDWVVLDLPPGPGGSRPGPRDGWQPAQLVTNRARVIPTTGEELPAEFADVGRLRPGVMDVDSPDYDSLATWHLDGTTLTLRVPWAQVGMADPSSRQALVPHPDGTATTVSVERIGLTVDAGDGSVPTAGIAWEPWNSVDYSERAKAGVDQYGEALADVGSSRAG